VTRKGKNKTARTGREKTVTSDEHKNKEGNRAGETPTPQKAKTTTVDRGASGLVGSRRFERRISGCNRTVWAAAEHFRLRPSISAATEEEEI